jgi:ERCC4-related helicase
MLALSSFQGDFLLMTAIALNNDYILGRIKLDSFDVVVFDEAHRVVAQGEELGQYRYSVHYKQLATRNKVGGNTNELISKPSFF